MKFKLGDRLKFKTDKESVRLMECNGYEFGVVYKVVEAVGWDGKQLYLNNLKFPATDFHHPRKYFKVDGYEYCLEKVSYSKKVNKVSLP